MNKFGIFINFWEKNWIADYEKYIRKAAGIGFDILEFQAQALLEMSDSKMATLKRLADDCNIELTYSLGLDPAYDISSADYAVRQRGIAYLQKIVEKVGFMQGAIISGVSYAGWGAPSGIVNDKNSIVKRSQESMREVVKAAADHNVTYCVEAVNRFEGCVINTAEEAVAYVKAIESDNIGVLLDTYHMNIEEANIGDAIRSTGTYLKGFHTGENNRSAPGRGHLNWGEIFGALKTINYIGRIVSEPFPIMGGEVGRDIKVWRNLVADTSEAALDAEAARLLAFQKSWF